MARLVTLTPRPTVKGWADWVDRYQVWSADPPLPAVSTEEPA